MKGLKSLKIKKFNIAVFLYLNFNIKLLIKFVERPLFIILIEIRLKINSVDNR